MSTTVKRSASVQDISERLFRDGVVVDLEVHYWKAIKSNMVDDLPLVRKKAVPGFVMNLGTKRLISKEDVYRFARFEGRGRYAISKRATRFPYGRTFFVVTAQLPALEADLAQIKADFNSAVQDFLRNYETRREEYLARFPEHRKRLAKEYPAREALEPKYRFEWGYCAVGVPEAVRQQEAYQRAYEARMEGFLGEAVTALRGQVAELCADVGTRIAEGKVVSDASLNRVRRFIDQFKTLNFVGDAEVERRLDALKESLGGRNAQSFASDEAARDALAASLAETRKLAEGISDVSAVTGEYRRRLK